jgi:hypothetical protein
VHHLFPNLTSVLGRWGWKQPCCTIVVSLCAVQTRRERACGALALTLILPSGNMYALDREARAIAVVTGN